MIAAQFSKMQPEYGIPRDFFFRISFFHSRYLTEMEIERLP
jgi:hypothetical protein